MGKKPINATHYDNLPPYPDAKHKRKNVVNVIVETPKGSRHKYALVSAYGIIAFHDVLPANLDWPYDYGFIPGTLAPDGDPLDVLIVSPNGLFSGCLIEGRILGAVRETKDGIENDRLIGVPLPSPGAPLPTDGYRDISDLPRKDLDAIKRFLVEYSSLQGHKIRVTSIVKASEAMKIVKVTKRQFKRS